LVGLPHPFMLNGYGVGQVADAERRMTLRYADVNIFGRPFVYHHVGRVYKLF